MAKITKTPQQWRQQLDEHTYRITREAATERPFTGQYYDFNEDGTYHCVCCGAALFLSHNKYDAGCGWPSFTQPLEQDAVDEHLDTSHFMVRTEVVCHQCHAHLGHVFTDGPAENGLRYCINSASLDFVATGKAASGPQERASDADDNSDES